MKFVKLFSSIFLLLFGLAHAHYPASNHQSAVPYSCNGYNRTQSNQEEGCHNFLCEEIDPFFYLRFGVSRLTFGSGDGFGPSIHVGRRYEMQDAAVDISVNWSQSSASREEHSDLFFSAPRIAYLIYSAPEMEWSVLFGPAVSWVYLKNGREDNVFSGVALEGSLGYEFHRFGRIHALIQMDVSQPLLAAKKDMKGLPAPVFTFSFGAGF